MSAAILLTGATGLIGGEVVVALAREGRRVRAVVRGRNLEHAHERLLARLRRSPGWHDGLARFVEGVRGDTSERRFGLDARDLAGVAAIVHGAANTAFAGPEAAQVRETNVGGAYRLLETARACRPGVRVLFLGTAAVAMGPSGACLDEDAPWGGYANAYTASKREAETVVREAARDGGLDAVVVRPSIVLARGVRDRSLARSILWSVPIMAELGEVPVDAASRIDLVPVDQVAAAVAALAVKPTLRHRLYHVSAGERADTFGALCDAIAREVPEQPRIRPMGGSGPIRPGGTRAMQRALEPYLPFLNADVSYSNARLRAELGPSVAPPPAVSYLPGLVAGITRREAMLEMQRP
jgi:nucleoside-diphosphate-sugar epimerase